MKNQELNSLNCIPDLFRKSSISTKRMFFFQVFAILLSSFVLNANSNESRAEGIIFFAEDPNALDQDVIAQVYNSFQILQKGYMVELFSGRFINLSPKQFRDRIEIPHLGGDFTRAQDFKELRSSFTALQEALIRFPKGKSLVEPISHKIFRIVSRGEAGEIYLNGQWTSIEALTSAATIAERKDCRKIKTNEGEEFTFHRAEPDGIVVMATNGCRKISFVNFPVEIQREFNYDPEKAHKFIVNQRKSVAAYKAKLAMEAREAQQLAERRRAEAAAMKMKQMEVIGDVIGNVFARPAVVVY